MSFKSFFAGSKIKIATVVLSIIAASTAIFYIVNIKSKAGSGDEFNPAFKAYVAAYTGGVISRESPIQIRFISEVVKSDELNTPIDKELFKFKPEIKGTAKWVDANTIQFEPDEALNPGTLFEASFKIGEVMKMPEDMETFGFRFQTVPQIVEINIDGLHTYEVHDLTKQKLNGTLGTSDVADAALVEQILTAKQDEKALKITWTHDEDKRTHYFQVENIARKEQKGKVELTWEGSPIQSETKGTTTYDIPALGDMILVSAKAVQGEEQYLELQFSDPLLPDQDLTGLITIKDVTDLRIVIDENVVRAYPSVRQVGIKQVTISEGVKNIIGKRFAKTEIVQVSFEEIKPSVRLMGKGVILPSTDGLIFPFEAVSLRSVNIKVMRIYESNIIQFFQVNNFDGERELRRVGKVVLNKTISLNNTSPNDYARWKTYSIDLSSLINADPGAIYQVKIGFSKKDSYYSCKDESNSKDQANGMVDNTEEKEDDDEPDYNPDGYYEYYEDENYYDGDYNYSDRDDPCKKSYYGDYRSIKRNIFASDLGIITKTGSSGNLICAVTDLKTTAPIEGAKVEVYNFQQQLMKDGTTNNSGITSIELSKKPFFLIVRKDKQIGYLRLDNGSALPVSNFDVSGVNVQKGIKGFLYGERGVWRPGDSLYLTFILEDKHKFLPSNQPVSFELYNPQGQVTKRMVTSNSVEGFYNFSTATSPDDPTGNWTAKVKVGGAEFTYPVKIETVMPNRLKIKIDFGDKILAGDKRIEGSLDVKWLHGATAKNLLADVTMKLLNGQTKFEKYSDYIFDDPAKSFEAEEIEIFKDKIDENGHASIDALAEVANNAPGVLTANFKVKVFEEGGAFSVDRFSVPYYPYNYYTGIKLPPSDNSWGSRYFTDTNNTVDIVSVDINGKPASGRKIELKIYQADWRWWWDRSSNDLVAFMNNSYKHPVLSDTVTTVNGKARWTFRIKAPAWGRYYIRAYDVEGKHSTGQVIYMDWPSWYGRSREKNQGVENMLMFTVEKDKYKVGENVNISIPSSANGRALVSLETGSKVINTFWVETKDGATPFSFPATEEMSPNVYVNVTLIQPHAQTKNDMPIRLFGIMPVKVEDPKTFLKPVITMKDEIRPEENVTVNVKEETGKSMTYTLAVVDEGLLDLTRFKTPDPWNNFYAREALGVSTWDMYNYVIGAFGEKMDNILAIGGDGELKGSEKNKVNRFKPVVVFMGPYTIQAGANASHTFKMPQYVGSVRVMVVAGNKEGAYGNAEKAVPVRKPLMLLATLPRVVGPEEYVALPVNIFAMTKNVKNVTIQVKTNEMFEIMEGSQKSVSFAEPGDEVVNFYLKVKSATGIGKVSVFATSGSEKTNADISIEVRNPNPPETRTIDTIIPPGKEWVGNYQPFGTLGSNKAILEVSSIPPVNLGDRLQYLIQYPYGCVEQTTSSSFPQLFIKDFVKSKDIVDASEQNVKAGIERLRQFQQAEGGLSYWPGAEDANSWGTTYSGHFMIEAEKKGYTLPSGFLNEWKKYQKKAARNWQYTGPRNGYYTYNNDLEQAYRLYTLALAKDPETGAMNRLKELKSLSIAAKWRLAAAYNLIGQTDVAKALINGVSFNIKPYRELSYTYGSELRDKAMILETLSMMGMRTQAAGLAKEIAESLSSKRWMSTQEVAFCLMAISKFANGATINSKVDFNYTINNEKSIRSFTDMKIEQVDLKVKQAAGTVKVKNNSTGVLYSRIILSGTPSAGNEKEAENNLTMKIEYKTMNGNAINVSEIEQGTDFMVEVSVTNPGIKGYYSNLSISQIFPSGWEIHNARMDNDDQLKTSRTYNQVYGYVAPTEDESEESDNSNNSNKTASYSNISIPTYRDIRDDRVYTFFDLAPNQTKTFRINLNASYLGKFYLPSVTAGAMYDGSISTTKVGKWVEVVKEGGKKLSLNE